MRIAELIRYDVPPDLIALWQRRESERLLPLQEQAVRRHALFDGGNLLIQAPTSSGKTFIGEMAAIQTALRRKKVVYLVPLRALAEEKYRDFQEKYAPYGLDVIVSTRDRREFDADFEAGRFSIAVAVYEKFSRLLVRRPERLQEIELVVADELELLSDPDRGPAAELLLTRVLQSNRRVIGLSAVVGAADRLAAWMRAELVQSDRRPVELRYGVLHDGRFRYRTYNELGEGEEECVSACGETPWETLTQNLAAFAEQDESCLVFVKARHEARRGAQLLAERLSRPAATETLDALETLEPTHAREALRETLASGVAFHNADLSPEERRLVEEAFRSGAVGVLVSTSTLATGMNLPAKNVFITADKWQYDPRFGMPWKTPILRGEYENMGGRAGRYGAVDAFGRAILIASSPFDEETLWRRYVEGQREPIEPRLGDSPLEDHVVQLVASRTCTTDEALCAFFEQTLTGQWLWLETLTREEVAFRVRAAANRAADAGLLLREPGGSLSPTPLGAAAAAKGIGLATARDLEAWLAASETREWVPLDLILAAALTPDSRLMQLTLTAREHEQADYPGRLRERAGDAPLAPDVPLNRLRNCTLTPFFEEVRAIKVALVLLDWIEEEPVYDIEEAYHTFMGQIRAAADQVGWLVEATAALAEASGARDEFVVRIAEVAERVRAGLREPHLAAARAAGLSRGEMLALAARRLDTPERIAAAGARGLRPCVDAAKARRLAAWAAAAVNQPAAAPGRPLAPTLVIDDDCPGQVLLKGTAVPLQEKQYRLIQVLARQPGACVPYDTIYHAVWGDVLVEPNQMHFQKTRLLQALEAADPAGARLITTVPKRGFVLNLPPDAVAFQRGIIAGAA